MKTVSSLEIRHSLSRRYPRAHIEVMDGQIDLWERDSLAAVYGQFIWQMRLIGLTLWLKNKLDCDKWAWLLRAYVIVRNALSRGQNGRALGLICYLRNGDPADAHAINAAMVRDGEGFAIVEIEPQPRGGLKTLTHKERDSVWLAIF